MWHRRRKRLREGPQEYAAGEQRQEGRQGIHAQQAAQQREDGVTLPGIECADHHGEMPSQISRGLEQREQARAAFRGDLRAQVLGQPGKVVEGGCLALSACELGGRAGPGGDGAGGCPADVLEPVFRRQACDEFGIDHTAGDAALHHQIAELFRHFPPPGRQMR